MLKALIIVDNQHRNNLIRLLMLNLPTIQIVGRPSSFHEIAERIDQEQPDVIFLDVDFQGEYMFDHMHLFSHSETALVFSAPTTNYAPEAHKFSPAYYLTKPFEKEQIEAALKAVFKRQLSLYSPSPSALTPLKSLYADILPLSKDIVFCRQYLNETYIALQNGKSMYKKLPLTFLEALLPNHLFTRINDKCIINLNHLVKIKDSPQENIILDTGDSLRLTEERKMTLLHNLQHIALIAS